MARAGTRASREWETPPSLLRVGGASRQVDRGPLTLPAAADHPQVQCVRTYKALQPDELTLEKTDILAVKTRTSDGAWGLPGSSLAGLGWQEVAPWQRHPRERLCQHRSATARGSQARQEEGLPAWKAAGRVAGESGKYPPQDAGKRRSQVQPQRQGTSWSR